MVVEDNDMGERYDIAIIGSGPAGISAALNAKIRNKEFILFGNQELSGKLAKAHGVNNYLGLYGKTGQEMVDAFKQHMEAMDIHFTRKRFS